MAAMKWWGWGPVGVEFTHEDKPDLGPFIKETLGVEVGRVASAPIRFKDLHIPEPRLPDGLRAALEQAVTAAFVSVDPLDRVVHARGKSLRDLIRQRRGDLPRVPDVVVRPGSEDEVTVVLRAAVTSDAVVIPFGGGSSISGSLEAFVTETRPVISVDLMRLDKLLAIDGMGHWLPREVWPRIVDAIARHARLNKQLVYHYFGSKNGLYQAVLEQAYADIRAREQSLVLADLPPERALRKLVLFAEPVPQYSWHVGSLRHQVGGPAS